MTVNGRKRNPGEVYRKVGAVQLAVLTGIVDKDKGVSQLAVDH